MDYIAHRETLTNRTQTVEEHCMNTAQYAERMLNCVNLPKTGYLAGLLHDAGKFSNAFQEYIREGILQRGSVIHTFQGCRLLLERYHQKGAHDYQDLTCELLAYAIASHH